MKTIILIDGQGVLNPTCPILRTELNERFSLFSLEQLTHGGWATCCELVHYAGRAKHSEPVELWILDAQHHVQERIDSSLDTWQQVFATMPAVLKQQLQQGYIIVKRLLWVSQALNQRADQSLHSDVYQVVLSHTGQNIASCESVVLLTEIQDAEHKKQAIELEKKFLLPMAISFFLYQHLILAHNIRKQYQVLQMIASAPTLLSAVGEMLGYYQHLLQLLQQHKQRYLAEQSQHYQFYTWQDIEHQLATALPQFEHQDLQFGYLYQPVQDDAILEHWFKQQNEQTRHQYIVFQQQLENDYEHSMKALQQIQASMDYKRFLESIGLQDGQQLDFAQVERKIQQYLVTLSTQPKLLSLPEVLQKLNRWVEKNFVESLFAIQQRFVSWVVWFGGILLSVLVFAILLFSTDQSRVSLNTVQFTAMHHSTWQWSVALFVLALVLMMGGLIYTRKKRTMQVLLQAKQHLHDTQQQLRESMQQHLDYKRKHLTLYMLGKNQTLVEKMQRDYVQNREQLLFLDYLLSDFVHYCQISGVNAHTNNTRLTAEELQPLQILRNLQQIAWHNPAHLEHLDIYDGETKLFVHQLGVSSQQIKLKQQLAEKMAGIKSIKLLKSGHLSQVK